MAMGKMNMFLCLFVILTFCLGIQCSSHVAEICGKGQGDKIPESPEEIIKETKAEENEDNTGKGKFFFQGDIRLTPGQKKKLEKSKQTGKRDVTSLPNTKWTETQNIKYVLDNSLSDAAKTAIKAAIRDIQKYTCLRFTVRNDQSIHFIKFIREDGCWSYVGRLERQDLDDGLKQEISIGDGCEYKGTVIHEIMHALGFHHEHSRIDRDNYIEILNANIDPDDLDQFQLEPDQTNLGVAYDYNSIMHYPLDAFTRNGQPTMRVKGDARGANIGHRDGMSAKDIEQIRIHYGCRSAKRRSGISKNETLARLWKRFAGGSGSGKSKIDDSQGGACQLYSKEENN